LYPLIRIISDLQIGNYNPLRMCLPHHRTFTYFPRDSLNSLSIWIPAQPNQTNPIQPTVRGISLSACIVTSYLQACQLGTPLRRSTHPAIQLSIHPFPTIRLSKQPAIQLATPTAVALRQSALGRQTHLILNSS